MQADEIRQLLRRVPFQPLRVRITDGRTFDIRHLGLTVVLSNTLIIGIPAPNDPEPVFEHYEIFPLTMVDRVETLTEASPPLSR
jgi:hypothetical protein